MMPFAGGIEATSNATLIFAAAAALIYSAMLARPPSWRRTVAKTGSTALLALIALVEGGPGLLVVALALSAAGDAALAQEGEGWFLGGLGAFLAAHLAYVALFFLSGEETSLALTFGGGIAVAIFAGIVLTRLWPALPRAMRPPVALYVAAIVAMGVGALWTGNALIIAGAFAFMASDAILAIDRFVLAAASPHKAWTATTLWWLYWGGQALITLGVLL
jgi:uncharacterized membrane protein YhhN